MRLRSVWVMAVLVATAGGASAGTAPPPPPRPPANGEELLATPVLRVGAIVIAGNLVLDDEEVLGTLGMRGGRVVSIFETFWAERRLTMRHGHPAEGGLRPRIIVKSAADHDLLQVIVEYR